MLLEILATVHKKYQSTAERKPIGQVKALRRRSTRGRRARMRLRCSLVRPTSASVLRDLDQIWEAEDERPIVGLVDDAASLSVTKYIQDVTKAYGWPEKYDTWPPLELTTVVCDDIYRLLAVSGYHF